MASHTPADPAGSRSQRDSSSTKVTEQRALTVASGSNWLVIGGGLSVICGGLLFAMQWLSPAIVATTGFVIVIVLYALMVVTRVVVRPGRVRLWTLATLTILLVITFFVCGGIVAATEWSAAGAR